MRNIRVAKTSWPAIACVSLLLWSGLQLATGAAQKNFEIRDITRTKWKDKRPGAPPRHVNVRYKITKRMYESAGSPTVLTQGAGSQAAVEDAEIGVTLWRLRPAKPQDSVEIRELVQHTKDGAKVTWTPERVTSDTVFREAEMVRLAIESLRPGYLYVINRARYADGTFSDPYLIFPTKEIYGGNNKVEAGRAIQIPGPDEEPFTLERGQSRQGELQRSEELIVLVTPQPLQSFPVAPPDRRLLTPQSVEAFIQRYAAPYEVSENIDSLGQAITVAEKRAAQTAGGRLSAADPFPQTIYRLVTKPGETMLIRFELKVY